MESILRLRNISVGKHLGKIVLGRTVLMAILCLDQSI